MGPVSHKPAGTRTTPPPFLLHSKIAALMLFVFKLIPSGLAPYFTILKVSFLNLGNSTTGSFGISLPSDVVENNNPSKASLNVVLFIIPFCQSWRKAIQQYCCIAGLTILHP